ncbi:MAG TPA: helix-turn-helix transcriptional regulator [Syntrophobacteraceae bacterium]|nr:helix-turn-helix transcriptional regulator [Syntrophobacteraceae bacterium]
MLKSRIRIVRGDLTQQAFADQLDIHFRTVQRWEAGTRLPCADDLVKIQQEFGININWLLTGTGPKYLRDLACPEPELKVCRIEDAPIERIKSWIQEIVEEQPAYRGWLDIEFPKRFPEFKEWLEKKQRGESLENSSPMTHENSA